MKRIGLILGFVVLAVVTGVYAQVFTSMVIQGVGSGQIGSVAAAGNFSVLPPYLSDGTNSYTFLGYQITKPPSSPVWINSVAPGTFITGTNGDSIIVTTGVNWQTVSATTSVEADFRVASSQVHTATNNSEAGVWMYDSTNSHIWNIVCDLNANNSSPQNNSQIIQVNEYNYNGSGNPAFNTTIDSFDTPAEFCHLKMVVAAGTLSFQISLNGGKNFITLQTEAVGTLAQAGYITASSGTGSALVDVYSLVTN